SDQRQSQPRIRILKWLLGLCRFRRLRRALLWPGRGVRRLPPAAGIFAFTVRRRRGFELSDRHFLHHPPLLLHFPPPLLPPPPHAPPRTGLLEGLLAFGGFPPFPPPLLWPGRGVRRPPPAAGFFAFPVSRGGGFDLSARHFLHHRRLLLNCARRLHRRR